MGACATSDGPFAAINISRRYRSAQYYKCDTISNTSQWSRAISAVILAATAAHACVLDSAPCAAAVPNPSTAPTNTSSNPTDRQKSKENCRKLRSQRARRAGGLQTHSFRKRRRRLRVISVWNGVRDLRRDITVHDDATGREAQKGRLVSEPFGCQSFHTCQSMPYPLCLGNTTNEIMVYFLVMYLWCYKKGFQFCVKCRSHDLCKLFSKF